MSPAQADGAELEVVNQTDIPLKIELSMTTKYFQNNFFGYDIVETSLGTNESFKTHLFAKQAPIIKEVTFYKIESGQDKNTKPLGACFNPEMEDLKDDTPYKLSIYSVQHDLIKCNIAEAVKEK